ncbi:MAG: DUF2029 domain-containing protein [Chloroflexi bacterium]|nr:DUF2029 domain-containing protein [Chloroflexota bacterium]
MERINTAPRRDRYLVVAAVTASIVLLAFELSELASYWPDTPLGTDFLPFRTGASLIREGAGPALYDMGVQQAFQHRFLNGVTTLEAARVANWLDPYHNPPPLALLLVPLTWLSIPSGYLLWWGVSLIAFLAAIALPLRGSPHARTCTGLMLTFGAVADNLVWGQVDALFLLALSLGLLAMTRKRPFLGGALLGFLWLKPQYAVLFPIVFLVKGRWRELSGMAVAGVVVAGLSLALVGLEGVLRYLELLRRIGAFYPPVSSMILPEIMVNWRGLLMNLWPGLPGAMGSILVMVLGAGTALISLLAWRGEWNPSSPCFARQVLVTILATLIAIPHSHFHGLVLLLAPVGLAVARPMSGTALSSSWRPLLVVGYLLAFILSPFEHQRWLTVPFFLTAMVILVAQCWGTVRTGATALPVAWFASAFPATSSRDASVIGERDAEGFVK